MDDVRALKTVFLVIAIIYFFSPVDLAPGILIDDVAVLGAALMPFFR